MVFQVFLNFPPTATPTNYRGSASLSLSLLMSLCNQFNCIVSNAQQKRFYRRKSAQVAQSKEFEYDYKPSRADIIYPTKEKV